MHTDIENTKLGLLRNRFLYEVAIMKKSIVVGISALLCAFSIGIFNAQAQTKLKKVKLAYTGWGIGTAVAYVGVDAGVFKQYELDVKEILISDPLTGGVQSLIGVDIVLGFGNPLPIFHPIMEGADIVFLGSHFRMENYGLGVAHNIEKIRDLKGKKIGVSGLGRRSDLIARVLLRRAGLDPLKDVEIVGVGFSPDRAMALSKNLIQGAPLSPGVALEAKKLGIKVLKVKQVPVVTSLLMTTRSMIKRDREAVRRFLKAYSASIHYYLSNPAKSIAIIKKYITDTDPNDVQAMYDAFAAQLRPLPDLNEESVQALIDVVSVADKRAKKLKTLDLFDNSFLEELKGSDFIKNLYTEKISL